MKRKTLALLLAAALSAQAQTDVTNTYLQNPDFAARYAGWLNEGGTKGAVGGFVHQTNNSFLRKSGEVYMERWVSQGSRVPNLSISQVVKGLPTGTYTLTAGAQNIQQGKTTQQTGAFLFANGQQTEVSDSATYSVTFSVITGEAKIGFKTVSATGNWACIDNFRLTQEAPDLTAIRAELQRLITEAESVLGSGETAADLQGAIASARSLLGGSTTEGIQEAALALRRATLNYRISNATGNVPTVTTHPYVAQGVTLALGRSTITANGSTLLERGFCWSTSPDPSILDERTTEFFTNNGQLYRMENLKPATIYYVRAYALTTGYQVAYGDVVKIATKPRGTVTYWYNYGGDQQQNYRINSALAECVWMYNHVANIQGFGISCTFGSATPTADCSYGGSMRVGPNTSYQQTGTILHETNHGVGVGTTSQWYNNSTLRANTTHGKWLGPCANEMVQFLQNDEQAFLTGDGVHMWGSTTSGTTMKSYAINGAHEDSYSPADQLLYWGNILITHALHLDGLPCSGSVGFATPAFVFAQQDGVKYYIKSEDPQYGLTSYLSHTATGMLRNVTATRAEALANDSLAWHIDFNPATGYYTLRNAASGRYLGLSGITLRAVASASDLHLLPSRSKHTLGNYTGRSYWITLNKGTYALRAGAASVSTAAFDDTNAAAAQRWHFLTGDQLESYESGALTAKVAELDVLLAHIRSLQATPHEANTAEDDVTAADAALEQTLATIEQEKAGYTAPAQVSAAIEALNTALVGFLSQVRPSSVATPFDLSFLLVNPSLDGSNNGWSDNPTHSYSCSEYYTTSSFDFNQTTALKLPKGTYEVRAQAFQRPGSYADVYTQYVTNGTDNVKAQLYAKTRSAALKNIYADAQTTPQGTGSVAAATRVHIPNTMQGASNFFAKGLYDNSVMVTTTATATFKLGIRCTGVSANYWTCFDNFRLYYYGGLSIDHITPVEPVRAQTDTENAPYYDLSGRPVARPKRGLYIRNGKKAIIRE